MRRAPASTLPPTSISTPISSAAPCTEATARTTVRSSASSIIHRATCWSSVEIDSDGQRNRHQHRPAPKTNHHRPPRRPNGLALPVLWVGRCVGVDGGVDGVFDGGAGCRLVIEHRPEASVNPQLKAEGGAPVAVLLQRAGRNRIVAVRTADFVGRTGRVGGNRPSSARCSDGPSQSTARAWRW